MLERVRTVNESIAHIEKFFKAKAKAAESDEARAAVATERQAELDEVGPRLVLKPVRIISSGFGGAILCGA